MRLESWETYPRSARVAVWLLASAIGIWWVKRHLADFRNVTYLGGLIGLQIVLAGLWHFETVFFPLVMGCFLWAGMNLPWTGLANTGRWLILGVGALAGCFLWLRGGKHHYTLFHLLALFCVVTALVSAMVSADPTTAVLKALSLFLLFLYGMTGARLAILGREAKFVLLLMSGCEVITYLTAISRFVGLSIWGNPNSLGGVMGVVMTPFLLWGLLIAETPKQRYRRAIALALAGFLLYTSLSRAGMLAGTVAVVALLAGLRRQRLLIQIGLVAAIFIAFVAVLQPSHFDEFLDSFTENVVYKGKKESGVFASRKTPWEQTTTVIKQHPWFGSGFGTSNMGQFEPGTKTSMSRPGLSTAVGTNREHGNSYLALAEYLGLVGILPFAVLLFLIGRMIVRVWLWMRRTSNPYHCAIPLATMLLAGMAHAFFEDWMVAVGYYLCVFFWISAFWLIDLMPVPISAPRRVASSEYPATLPHSGILAPTR